MHHVVIERWSRGQSLLHRRDARVKLAVLLAFLVALATIPRVTAPAAAFAVLVLAGILAGRLPVGGVLLRAAAVLPFSGGFALISLLTGRPEHALALLVKSYLSAAAVLVLIGTTPLPKALGGLAGLGAPRFLILVVQFVYRYLFVISEQAQHMRLAARCRGSQARAAGRSRFRAAAGALAVLFVRSWARAEAIHHAMLARGFTGRIGILAPARLTAADAGFLIAGLAMTAGIRLAL